MGEVIVRCFLVLNFYGFRETKEHTGILLRNLGGAWEVNFEEALKYYDKDIVTPYVKIIDSNACLVVSGKIPYGG